MINFLRVINNIKVGDYLHCDGSINDIASSDVIGICVIPGNFLPDRYARFMSLFKTKGPWSNTGAYLKEYSNKDSFPISENYYLSPYNKNGSFNWDFLRDIKDGNIFQDYKGYENTRIYKEKYGKTGIDAFNLCSKAAPSYRNKDWYLPSIGEMAFIPPRFSEIEYKLRKTIDAGSSGIVNGISGYFWSSSERNIHEAWSINFINYVYIGCAVKDYFGNSIRAFLTL